MKKPMVIVTILAVAVAGTIAALTTGNGALRGDVSDVGDTAGTTMCPAQSKIITLTGGGTPTTIFKVTANAFLAKRDDAKGNAQATANAEGVLASNCSAQVGIMGTGFPPMCDAGCSAGTVGYRTKTTKTTPLNPFQNTSGQWQYGADVEGECYSVRPCSGSNSSPGRRLDDENPAPDMGMSSSDPGVMEPQPGTTLNPDAGASSQGTAQPAADPGFQASSSFGLQP